MNILVSQQVKIDDSIGKNNDSKELNGKYLNMIVGDGQICLNYSKNSTAAFTLVIPFERPSDPWLGPTSFRLSPSTSYSFP